MPVWNAAQYLKFAGERKQPCRDLLARVEVREPGRVIDLGCGPGNSTAELAARWPEAEITGLDSSAEMIAAARGEHPGIRWEPGEIHAWAEGGEPYDVVFSNAALQWVEGHEKLFPRLLARVAPGGVLAVQMPANYAAPQHRILREMAARPVREWYTHPAAFYYDTLAPLAERLDLWVTTYFHRMADVDGIVEFYKGTGLRPYLEALADSRERERFTTEFRARLGPYFPAQPDGTVLFPFERLFMVARQGAAS